VICALFPESSYLQGFEENGGHIKLSVSKRIIALVIITVVVISGVFFGSLYYFLLQKAAS
jgi:hypothetical protein